MLGIIIAFITINVLLYFRQQLYTAILAGLVLIVLFNPISPTEAAGLFFNSATSPIAIMLCLIILFFTGFGNLLKEMGSLQKMVENLSLILRDLRLQLAVIPALMGLMAFPGGAVFSAPLVEEAGKMAELDKHRLALINVLFRHVTYLIFPLYTTLILIGEITPYSITSYIAINIPLFVIALIVLSLTLFRGIQQPPKTPADYTALPPLLYSMAPLLVVLILAVALNIYLPLAIIIGILIALFQSLPTEPIAATLKYRLSILWKGINWHMAASIVSIIIFKDFLIESNAINALVGTLTANGFPLIILALLVPYTTGFITGNHTAAIGISAPLFLTAAPPNQAFYYLALIFITGLSGYQGSPLHMCTVLTAQHFNISLTTTVRRINMYTIPLSVMAAIFFAILM